jgi:tRNA (cytidine/uridine-2'-O-)-methyltransferase
MNIVLHEPEIPLNTGNIGRTCVATGTTLHLIRPLGFSTDPKYIKRSGLDYWDDIDIRYYDNYDDFVAKNPSASMYCIETKGNRYYTDVTYQKDDFLMFGKESAGIPDYILDEHIDRCLKIPMLSSYRSLNLGNCVAIVLFEALRQVGFGG